MLVGTYLNIKMNKELDLLNYLKGGSEEAYKLFFYTNYSDLVMFANSIIKNTSAAEDIVQDFFVDFWTKKYYNSINSNLSSFLFKSVRNKCLNYIRDNERRNKHLSDFSIDDSNVDSNLFDYQEKELLYKAINMLPEKSKDVFIRCCIHGHKYQEVADDLGISINTVRTHMARSFKSLRNKLNPQLFSSFMFVIHTKK